MKEVITQAKILKDLNAYIKHYKELLHNSLRDNSSQKRIDEIATKLENIMAARELISK